MFPLYAPKNFGKIRRTIKSEKDDAFKISSNGSCIIPPFHYILPYCC